MSSNRMATLFRITGTETARNYVLLGLLVVLPILFITVAIAVTQDAQMPIELPIDGETQVVMRGLPAVHGIAMAPIASTIIAGIVGLLLMQSAKETDRRLVLAGYRARDVILARFGTLALLVLLITVVSVGVLALDVVPEQPVLFLGAMFLVTAIYGLVGMLLGVIVGRVAGLWLVLVLSMLDIGLFQSPLFPMVDEAWWVQILPGHHPMEVVFDAGMTAQPDTLAHLLWGTAYLIAVGLVAIVLFYRLTKVR